MFPTLTVFLLFAPAAPTGVRADGAAALIEHMASDAGCGAAIPALVDLGEPAVEAALSALPASTNPARWCLLETLQRLARRKPLPASATGPLLWAFRAADAGEEKAFAVLLARVEPSPAAEVAAAIDDPALLEDRRIALARILATLPGDGAPGAAKQALGRYDGPLRAAIRQAATGLDAPTLLHDFVTVPGDVDAQGQRRRADLLLLLAVAVRRSGDPASSAPARDAALHAFWALPATFEVQARALSVLGAAADGDAMLALDEIRATSPDAVLRDLAAQELAAVVSPATTEALRAALLDADPRVRATAATALGERGDHEAAAGIIAGAKQEPWPLVRRAEVVALGRLCGAAATDLLIRAIGRDVEEIKQAAVDGLTSCRDPRAARVLTTVVAHPSASVDLRIRAAGRLGDLGDAIAAPDLARVLDRARASGDPGERALALAAIDALTHLCDPRAREALGRAAQDADPVMAGRAALAMACQH